MLQSAFESDHNDNQHTISQILVNKNSLIYIRKLNYEIFDFH